MTTLCDAYFIRNCTACLSWRPLAEVLFFLLVERNFISKHYVYIWILIQLEEQPEWWSVLCLWISLKQNRVIVRIHFIKCMKGTSMSKLPDYSKGIRRCLHTLWSSLSTISFIKFWDKLQHLEYTHVLPFKTTLMFCQKMTGFKLCSLQNMSKH